jgi:hypothetical protein
MELELAPENSKKAAPEPVEPPKAPAPRIHIPEVGSKLTINLPRESTRATVEEILTPSSLVVKLDVMEPMAKSHGYYFNDRVVVSRRVGLGNLPQWEATGKAET